jgi:beta-glucosidase
MTREERIQDLIAGMTLEEKVSLLSYESPAIERLGIPEYNWWNECHHGVARAGFATVFPQAIYLSPLPQDYSTPGCHALPRSLPSVS